MTTNSEINLSLCRGCQAQALIVYKKFNKEKKINLLSNDFSCSSIINTKKRGDVIADITSADELSIQQKNGIKFQLRSLLGEKLLLNFKVDKKIIGGLIVKVGSKMIDSSLALKINKLKIAMKGI